MKRISLAVSPGRAVALGLAYLLFVSAVLGVGTLAAAGATSTAANDTVAVDGETQSVWAEIAANESAAANDVTVTFHGVDSDGETQEDQQSVNVAANETQMVEYEDVNASAYSEYRVVVEGENIDEAKTGTIEKVAGGGGLPGGDVGGVPVVAVVAVLGAAYVYRRD